MLKMATALVLAALLCGAMAGEARGHSVILSAQGLKAGNPAGPVGQALAVDPSTPRTYAAVEPNQRDTTIFNQRAMSLWSGCGQTIEFGVHKPEELIPKLASKGQIAQALAGGQLSMVLHQINGDGNGPYTCAVDSTATARKGSWKKIEVAKQVPGQSPELNAVVTTQFPFIVNLPSDLQCTGSFALANGTVKKNICLLRCQNFAENGPYGACVPFELVKAL
jgi:hypothetical protein